MNRLILPLVLTFGFLLAACATRGSAAGAAQASPTAAPVNAAATEARLHPDNTVAPAADLKRTDGQGMVTVEVTPLNLDKAADTVTLDFDVAMNTHSVDLSMDLAQLATLTTDTGVSVKAAKWEATPGGHHVSGKLIFPATQDGKGILEGATKLTLTIVNVDAPSRVFEWQLK